ncbi:MAG: nucleotidyltransferase substrate binding protein [Desulfosarcina sp.]|nr:nucleotidyltransferase substrate binding protein [Desulfosarcina sp.]MBC2744252.1 nucleotidyltransferase substrate binding protein [Desulfosarcina sp.]MBC2767161.1 nucleotidyltransferase [Desulfosarcina sp.]
MKPQDIRWEQRLANYSMALAQLTKAVDLAGQRPLSELEQQGLIQAFEFTHELAWNVMKDYFAFQGDPSITGSRDAVRESFNKGLITDGEGWMEMIKSRNQSSHTYNQKVAEEIVDKVVTGYHTLFHGFLLRMQELKSS